MKDISADRTSKKSLTAKILDTLRNRILSNEYEATGNLPSEPDLVDEFGASRHTIRIALHKLEAEGLIERRRGARTVVISRDSAQSTWSIASLDQITGFFSARVPFSGIVKAADYPDMATILKIPESGELFKIVYIFLIDGLAQSYSELYTRTEYGSIIPQRAITSDFFVNVVEKYCGLRATRAKQVTSAAMPTPEAQRTLKLARNQPVLVLNRTFFSGSAEAIHHARIQSRPDTFPQVVNFYRAK